MASSSNGHRCSKKLNSGNADDRISNLPELILVHILSFLPTKYAVGTSILSSRWKYIWTAVPILDFDHELVDPSKLRDVYAANSRFMNFVDRVLLFHDLRVIKKFRLSWGSRSDMSRLNTWVGVVLRRCVRELDLSFLIRDIISLPVDLFTCHSLVILKLEFYHSLFIPSYVCLPCLKTLHLSLNLPNNELTEKFSSSFPVLETLFIKGMARNDAVRFDISMASLKWLKLNLDKSFNNVAEGEIRVSAPTLQYLSISGDYLANYKLSSLNSLIKADVNAKEDRNGEINVHTAPTTLLIQELSCVEILCLGARTMPALDDIFDFRWPLYPKLCHLELSFHKLCSLSWFWKLLSSAPKLSSLVLGKELERDDPTIDDDDNDFDGFDWVNLEVPICLLANLKEIRIVAFQGLKNELELLKYLLENAKVLNKMTLCSGVANMDIVKENTFLKTLLKFPRGSTTCQIEFS